MNDLIGYKREIDYLQARTREKRTVIDDEHNEELGKIKERYNIPPKEIATYNDLVRMIAIVLETGKSGRVVIKKYAEQAEKTEKWRKEIAKYRVKNGFKLALFQYQKDEIILRMKENNVYDEKDILNNSISGALTKLSKQMKISKVIDDLKNEVSMLRENLAVKTEGKDWKEKAIELYKSDMSYRKIGKAVGKSKSAVEKCVNEYKAKSFTPIADIYFKRISEK